MTEQAPQAAKPTVFVVDDNDDVRTAMRRMLEGAGFAVQAYADGATFLAAHVQARPSCLVIDQTMPGMSGLHVLLALQSLGRRLPSILLTGSGSSAIRDKAISLGAVAYLEKPVDGEQLLDCVRRALELDQQQPGT